eukprot:CAMPEP_0181249334 /NCGR_PEP_ID=MMETSP1096-20121128/45694_1 /TAXON_ID=156174 ORGANISM="Chrysochromulina ericina, Strain CCMP281" /NCGR_SAMPLE_ID=MMETSP1096 /ASSEMBLY_ACC=CAM_ASM_000453 /LENGTH=83 /DNA_ID=CAMNT_0023346655 /DNA_START=420 /DNA_END=668 /DNA_ORIENTATION=+
MAVTILAARPRQHDASVHGGMRSGQTRRWRSQQWDGQVGVRDEPMAQIEDIGHAVVRLHVCAGRSHRTGVAAEARPELENWLG